MEAVLIVAAAVAALVMGARCRVWLAASGCVVLAGALVLLNQARNPGEYTPANDLVFFLSMVGAPAVVGGVWSARGRQLRELHGLSTLRAAQHAAELRAARLEEQSRIASRLQHDIIQTMGEIVLRSAGATRSEAGAGSGVLPEIERSARRALDGLRHEIGVLREPVVEELPATPVTGAPAAPRLAPVDVLVGLGGSVPLAVEAVLGGHSHGPAAANVVVALLLAVPLALRRRQPLVAAAAVFLVAAAMGLVLTPPATTVSAIVPALLVSYAVGAHAGGWHVRLVGTAVVWGGALLVGLATPAPLRDPAGLPPTLLWTGLAVVAGAVAAGRAERVLRMRRLLTELDAGREAQRRLATAEERHAIARDLHDSVAVTMTVVCLHAAAARRLPAGDTRALRAALGTIESTARSGLAELRTSLDALDGETAQGMDLHGLGIDVAQVVTAAQGAGIEVRARLADLSGLPVEVRGVAARLVREALVNAARHAPGADVDVRVLASGDGIRVEVADSGSSTAPQLELTGTGHGLRGLAERVGALGGRFESGPHDGGFRVFAEIPVGAGVPA